MSGPRRRFRFIKEIAEGGFGKVYLAEQRSLKRKVALKVLKPELARNETALKRFEAEAMAVARITHANIVQVYAFNQHEGLWYMALEYVRAATSATSSPARARPSC